MLDLNPLKPMSQTNLDPSVEKCARCGLKFTHTMRGRRCPECGSDFQIWPKMLESLAPHKPSREPDDYELDHQVNGYVALGVIDRMRDKLNTGGILTDTDWSSLIDALVLANRSYLPEDVKRAAGWRFWPKVWRGLFMRWFARLLKTDDIEWVVNSRAELGVKIGNRFIWMYKGRSLEYSAFDMPKKWRRIHKREFGECCCPSHYLLNPKEQIPVPYDKGEDWLPLPTRKEEE